MFNHGIATLKRTIKTEKFDLEVGDQGIITCFLPEEKIFAVLFGELPKWITFKDYTEEEFKKICDVELTEQK